MNRRSLLIMLSLGLGAFLTLFDMTAVLLAMPGIAKELGFNVAGVAWVIDAYSLAFTAALVASGALADRFGRRRSMLTGNAVFLVASVACGLAPSGTTLLAARVLQGLSAAFLVTGASALIASTFTDLDQRARVYGTFGVIAGVAMALGPSLGGLLVSWAGWRWIFFANVPFCLVLAVGVPSLVSESNDPDRRPVSILGVVLLSVSLGLFIDALLRRDSSIMVKTVSLIGSVITAAVFGWQQSHSPRPVLDPRVFGTLVMGAAGTLLTAMQFGYWAVLVYLPLFLDAGLLMRTELAGVALLAATLPMLFVPLIGSRLLARWGWKRFFATAFSLIAIGDVLLLAAALTDRLDVRFAATIAGMVTIGIGAALANPQIGSVIFALASPGQTAMVSAVAMIVRQAGFVISIAVLGAALATVSVASAFAPLFMIATFAAVIAVVTSLRVLPMNAHTLAP
jgi:MFS family permease